MELRVYRTPDGSGRRDDISMVLRRSVQGVMNTVRFAVHPLYENVFRDETRYVTRCNSLLDYIRLNDEEFEDRLWCFYVAVSKEISSAQYDEKHRHRLLYTIGDNFYRLIGDQSLITLFDYVHDTWSNRRQDEDDLIVLMMLLHLLAPVLGQAIFAFEEKITRKMDLDILHKCIEPLFSIQRLRPLQAKLLAMSTMAVTMAHKGTIPATVMMVAQLHRYHRLLVVILLAHVNLEKVMQKDNRVFSEIALRVFWEEHLFDREYRKK